MVKQHLFPYELFTDIWYAVTVWTVETEPAGSILGQIYGQCVPDLGKLIYEKRKFGRYLAKLFRGFLQYPTVWQDVGNWHRICHLMIWEPYAGLQNW